MFSKNVVTVIKKGDLESLKKSTPKRNIIEETKNAQDR